MASLSGFSEDVGSDTIRVLWGISFLSHGFLPPEQEQQLLLLYWFEVYCNFLWLFGYRIDDIRVRLGWVWVHYEPLLLSPKYYGLDFRPFWFQSVMILSMSRSIFFLVETMSRSWNDKNHIFQSFEIYDQWLWSILRVPLGMILENFKEKVVSQESSNWCFF